MLPLGTPLRGVRFFRRSDTRGQVSDYHFTVMGHYGFVCGHNVLNHVFAAFRSFDIPLHLINHTANLFVKNFINKFTNEQLCIII